MTMTAATMREGGARGVDHKAPASITRIRRDFETRVRDESDDSDSDSDEEMTRRLVGASSKPHDGITSLLLLDLGDDGDDDEEEDGDDLGPGRASAASTQSPRIDDADDDEEDHAQTDTVYDGNDHRMALPSPPSSNRELTAREELLRHAEQRIERLERRLLDAEETICHLKAERRDAWREVERLTRQHNSAGASEEHETLPPQLQLLQQQQQQQQKKIGDLERQLRELVAQHQLEQDERMAVIREQEHELVVLRGRLEALQDHADDVESRYHQLLETSPPTSSTTAAPGGSKTSKSRAPTSCNTDQDNDDVSNTIQPPPAADDASATTRTWQEEWIRHPTPRFDLDSPEVQYLLCAWTANNSKRQYLRTWLTHVAVTAGPLPADFPMGLELPRLRPEIRDGLLTLVVPLLRKQTWREVVVHTRPYADRYHTDVRLRVVPRVP